MGAGETRQAIETVGLIPGDAEVFGLLALMEIQASRLPARSGPAAFG
jgi:predicted RNA polymerase sigma factor